MSTLRHKLSSLRYIVLRAGLWMAVRIPSANKLMLRILCSNKPGILGHVLPVQTNLGAVQQHSPSLKTLEELINSASSLAIASECICRKVGGCTDYPSDLGCLILGSDASMINPALGRPVDAEEALTHVCRALSLGLVPMTTHFCADGILWDLRQQRIMSLCFCCPCHCILLKGRASGSKALLDGLHPAPGLSLCFDERKCLSCGQCVAECMTSALSLPDGQLRLDTDKCLCCGRCAAVCPAQALSVQGEDELTAPALMSFYTQRLDVSGSFSKFN